MSVGSNIKKIRIEKNLTQKQLGDLCGMADSAIRRYESDRGNPTEKTLQRIAKALDVSKIELLTGMTEQEWNKQLDDEWAEYEASNKGYLFFNFVCRNPLLLDILSAAYIDLSMDKEGRIIATYEDYEKKEIFIKDLEKLQDSLSSCIMECVKESLGLPFDPEELETFEDSLAEQENPPEDHETASDGQDDDV